MTILCRLGKMECSHNIFYLRMIYGGEGVARLVIAQELGNKVCPLGVNLIRSTCKESGYRVIVKSTDSGTRLLGFKPWFCHSLALCLGQVTYPFFASFPHL